MSAEPVGMPLSKIIDCLMELNLNDPLTIEFQGNRFQVIHFASSVDGAELVDIKVKLL